MRDDVDWDLKIKDDGIHKIAGGEVLQCYGVFLEEYANQLSFIQEARPGSLDIANNPVTIELEPKEQMSMIQLVDTDNKVLNKILSVFTMLCVEVQNLQAEANKKYIEPVLYYGEGWDESTMLEAIPQLLISQLLPHLQDLVSYMKRCIQILKNIVQQLAAFYTFLFQSTSSSALHDVHLQDVYEHVGELLLILSTFDDIFENQSTLSTHWELYKDSVQSAIQDKSKLDFDTKRLKQLKKSLSDIEAELFTGKMFQGALNLLNEKDNHVKNNPILGEEFNSYVKTMLLDLDTKQQNSPDPVLIWGKVVLTYVFSAYVFGIVDKKIHKQVWDMSKKFPTVTLIGNIIWFPDKFMTKHLGHLTKQFDDRKPREAVSNARQNYSAQSAHTLPREVQLNSLQVCSWIIQIESCMKRDVFSLKQEDLDDTCLLFLEGIQLSSKMQRLMSTVLRLHAALGKPMTKSSVLNLCAVAELVKAVDYLYMRHYAMLPRFIPPIIQLLKHRALTIIALAKKGMGIEKHYSEVQVDVLSSLVLAEKCLYGPATKNRFLVSRLALTMANRMRTFREEELSNLSRILSQLSSLCSIQDKLYHANNCDSLYWDRVILPVYLKSLYENKSDLQRTKYFLRAFHENGLSMELCANKNLAQSWHVVLDSDMTRSISTQILKPLCQEIETDLRLQIHSHLQREEQTLKLVIQDYRSLIRLQPLFLFTRYINLKGGVEHYLNGMFYDLTTVALHDWRTYGEMRSLGRHKFDLDTVEDNLPSQTLEQGLDVLEIMRNIHIFVSKYLYNLNNQIFIEHSSNNKYLNTINIGHIGNSIRTHGIGIMNTTVNFTYQFLHKKLLIFSQFLYDEHIKSRLLKDLCYFRDHKAQIDSKYSFERAKKFNKGIRKLGLTPEGLTYLDQFRILITHIGNALGYVRMIRSGGLHCCIEATSFIPDLEDIIHLKDLCLEEGLSTATCEAAHCLDEVISNMSRNLSEGTEYFKLLVDVFTPVFRDPKNSHLKHFYMIVPPLTINYVEHIISSKEKMNKKSKIGAAFTDDGFAMGVAYALKVLDLFTEFDSLHWFQSVFDKYHGEKSELAKQSQIASHDDDKLQQTLNLTSKRLEIYQQEFTLLYYSLSSARIFFQRDQISHVGDKKKTKENEAAND